MNYKTGHLPLLLISSMFLFSSPSKAISNSLSYQGRIIKPDGRPLEYHNISFLFKITDPSGQCVIYQEHVSGIDLTNSKGVFDVPIGTGTVSWPTTGSFSILDAFNNGTTFPCSSCIGYSCDSSGSAYSPIDSDSRLLRVQFHDGIGWKTISPDNIIRSVPYAAYSLSAQKLGTYDANAFVLKDAINENVSCAANSFLTWDATSKKFGCEEVSGALGGTVTTVTVASPLHVAGGASTPHITLQVANSSQNGYLASTDWITFNSKVSSSTSFNGDVSGTVSNISVDKIKGTSLSFSSLTNGDVLKYNNGDWKNHALGTSDISGLNSYLAGKVDYSQFPTSCTTAQTLTFISPIGGFSCTNIGIYGSQVSGNISGNAANFTGALSGDVTGTQSNTVVEKVRGVNISATPPAPGQVLKYDGTTNTWTPSSDIDTASTATSANINDTVVRRDASGNFSAGTISANLLGNVTGAASLNVLKTGDSMAGNLTYAANIGNAFSAGIGTNTVTVVGPASSIGTSYILRMPTSQSSGSQALINDGSGNLSWQTLITSSGLTSLNSQTGASQSFAVPGNSGSAPAWSSASNIHTLNIPLAATPGVTAGLISKAQYDAFNSKQVALGFTPLNPANNLSEITNSAAARSNIGLGTSATINTGTINGTIPLIGADNRLLASVIPNIAATTVTNTAAGNISATNIQAAINELDAEKVSITGDTMTGALNLPSNGLTVGTNQLIVSGSNVGIGKSPGVKLDVNGSIRPGSLGVSIGAACTGEGSFAYDQTARKPVFCDQTGAWAAIGEGLSPATAKAWVNFDGLTCSPNCTIRSSYNVSSVVRVSRGIYTINLASTMSNSNYVVIATAYMDPAEVAIRSLGAYSKSNGSFTVRHITADSSNGFLGSYDYTRADIVVFGN